MENKTSSFPGDYRKINMKITVLLFQSDPETDSVLADALGSAGIRVCRKNGLSGMHHQLSSRLFDVILVDEAILTRYDFSPSRHLWKSSSPHTIMVFSIHTGECRILTYSIPQEASGVSDRSEKAAILSKIESTVKSAFAPACRTAAVPTPAALGPCAIPVLDIPLQKKPAGLLATLVQAGPEGADLSEIALKLWGTIEPDRRKDIQIYVTRVRNALESNFPQRYRIRLSGTHYILVDTVA